MINCSECSLPFREGDTVYQLDNNAWGCVSCVDAPFVEDSPSGLYRARVYRTSRSGKLYTATNRYTTLPLPSLSDFNQHLRRVPSRRILP